MKQGKNGKMPPWGDLLSDDEIGASVGLCFEPEEAMKIWLHCAAAIALQRQSSAMPALAAADEALRVCLDEDLPPLSVHHRGKPDSGFDVALAQAVAERLGRPLKIQWFESKLDEDFEPGAGSQRPAIGWPLLPGRRLCLTKDSLVVPGVKTAKLPDFEGATSADRRRRVPLGVLAPSQPYIYSPLTVVLGPKARDRHVAGIGDLAGLRIGIESGTLGRRAS